MSNTDIEAITKNKKKVSLPGEILQWVAAVLAAVVIAMAIRTFIFEPVEVQGYSMEDTLQNKERLVLYKLGYFIGEPVHGDIVVLEYKEGIFAYIPFLSAIKGLPQEIDYIKRVIAVAGDEVDIANGNVYVNGIMLREDYVKGTTKAKIFGTGIFEYPITVPEGTVFVLGDNRENSSDSRVIGFVNLEKIKGKAVFRFWPFDRTGKLE